MQRWEIRDRMKIRRPVQGRSINNMVLRMFGRKGAPIPLFSSEPPSDGEICPVVNNDNNVVGEIVCYRIS